MIVIVKDIPEVYYMVLTFVIFILSMVVLSLIFVPKLVIQYKYSKMSVQEQRSRLAVSVRESSGTKSNRLSLEPVQPSRPLYFAEKESVSSAPGPENKEYQSKEQSETAGGSSYKVDSPDGK